MTSKPILLILTVMLAGCQENSKAIEAQEARNQLWADHRLKVAIESENNCLSKKKSIIRSAWDGRMIDCK